MPKCTVCGIDVNTDILKKIRYICPECGNYMRIGAYDRLEMLLDKNSFNELFEDVESKNPLSVKNYELKLKETKEKTGLREAVVTGIGKIRKESVAIAVCDTSFLMGSMGYAVGERITSIIEYATYHMLPVFIFCGSGGARMQEGIISLMQMEKTAAAMKRHDNAGLFSCTVLTNPTTGGVTASFAMLGDVIMAEPGALIGFAGPRVVEQTIGQKLPIGFQSADFQLRHGMVDGIVERKNLRKMMRFFIYSNKKYGCFPDGDYEVRQFSSLSLFNSRLKSNLAPWERVRLQRGMQRKSAIDYVNRIFDVFIELKGDRYYGDDRAIIGGIAMLNMRPITIIADDRGNSVDEMIACNFGMPLPEGYRKSLRLMKQAEKFGRPIVTFVNTPGAHCGIEAEERGQAMAIAQNLYEMADIKVPILAIIIGEAGSGGALATAVANEVWMLENATYSIISPEGYASIVWKDASRAVEAAENMHITSEELKKLGVIEEIIPEYGNDNDSIEKTSKQLKNMIIEFIKHYDVIKSDEIVNRRYNRFREF